MDLTEGCWVAYAHDDGPYLIGAWPTEVEALRQACNGYGYAMFLPWGKSLSDAVNGR